MPEGRAPYSKQDSPTVPRRHALTDAQTEALPTAEPGLIRYCTISPADLSVVADYAVRFQPRYDQFEALYAIYGFRTFTQPDQREMAEWLLPVALTTTSGVAAAGLLLEDAARHRGIRPQRHRPPGGGRLAASRPTPQPDGRAMGRVRREVTTRCDAGSRGRTAASPARRPARADRCRTRPDCHRPRHDRRR
ncbi:hypothetical protein DEW08_00790 [Azospirillum thermophilum]|uniref:DUF4158 domain-containing protein n=1 Tax=Azospirillum thermophilum TaxID=2202148 RepID=A0A2S2CK86_9PROT|nr:hypothetical protein DEW08_00790 [Azospirillum thermophilum]